MTEQELLSIIADSMDLEPASLTKTAVLADFPEWDSLAMISLIAMCSKKYGKLLNAREVKEQRTALDLLNLMQH